MYKFSFLIAIFLCFGVCAEAQDVVTTPRNATEEMYVDLAEQMPSFPGGTAALMQFIATNMKYPDTCLESRIEGRVLVRFIVRKDGSITDIEILKSVHPMLDKEAARIVGSMPKWIPGMQNDQPIAVKYVVPVAFRLQ